MAITASLTVGDEVRVPDALIPPVAMPGCSGTRNPSLTLKTYADLFDSDLDASADVLDQHRTAALQPSIANGDSETDQANVVGTLQQSA